MWLKLQPKRISSKENLVCPHLKYNCVMLLMVGEVCQKISLNLLGISAFELTMYNTAHADCFLNVLCLKQEVLKKARIN